MTVQTTEQVRIRPPDARRRSRLGVLLASDWAMAVASPILMLLAWELLVRSGALDERFFPAPSAVLTELVSLLRSGELFVDLGWTLERVVIGFLLGAIPGIGLGIAMGLSAPLRAFLKPAIASLYPIPKIALFPLIMLIFGLGESSKWVIVGIAVCFQTLISTMAGVVNIESIYLDVAKNFGASRWYAYRTIAVPGALPFIFAGCQLGLGMALIVVVIAENFGTKAGLGYLIWRSWQVFEVRDLYVGLVMVALLGYGSQLLMGWLERMLVPWRAVHQFRSRG